MWCNIPLLIWGLPSFGWVGYELQYGSRLRGRIMSVVLTAALARCINSTLPVCSGWAAASFKAQILPQTRSEERRDDNRGTLGYKGLAATRPDCIKKRWPFQKTGPLVWKLSVWQSNGLGPVQNFCLRKSSCASSRTRRNPTVVLSQTCCIPSWARCCAANFWLLKCTGRKALGVAPSFCAWNGIKSIGIAACTSLDPSQCFLHSSI